MKLLSFWRLCIICLIFFLSYGGIWTSYLLLAFWHVAGVAIAQSGFFVIKNVVICNVVVIIFIVVIFAVIIAAAACIVLIAATIAVPIAAAIFAVVAAVVVIICGVAIIVAAASVSQAAARCRLFSSPVMERNVEKRRRDASIKNRHL